MRNQTKRVFTHKSKVFLTILCMLGLVFSWSCSCKNRVSNPDDTPTDGGVTPPPGTFSISEATNNVTTNFVVKTSETIGTIKIGFVSANNYPYTLSYEVVDNEGADDNSKILKSDTEYANDVLTIKDTGLAKIRAIDSSTAPAVRTITINFTFTADDKTLNNNTQTLSIEVKLTHAQEVKEDNIESILKKMDGRASYTEGQFDDEKGLEFAFINGKYSNGEFEIKNTSDAPNKFDKFPEAGLERCRNAGAYYLQKLAETTDDEIASITAEEEGGVNQQYFTAVYNVKWSDNFESTITKIKIKFNLAN